MTDNKENNIDLIRSLFKKSKIKSITEVARDASSRRYFRLTTNSKSYVVCLDEPFSEDNYPFIEVQKFLQKIHVRVPQIYEINPSKGYLLEEDLGDKTLLHHSCQFGKKEELNTYKKCIDLLVQFQSFKFASTSYSFQKIYFDEKKLNSEIDFSVNYLFKFLINESFSKWENEIKSIKNDFARINKIISQKSMVFSHRDFHSRNLMMKENELIVIDFQGARMGIPQYDLVSILEDCYYELDQSNKENLKKYYFGRLPQMVNDQKRYSDFSYFYDLMCLQRIFKALGTFAFLSDSRYTKHMSFAFEKIKKITWKYDDLYSLRKNFSAIYYEH